MDRMLFIAMSGAREIERSLAVNTHNLANVSTTGFRADLEAAIARPVYGPGHADRVYTETRDLGSMDFSAGSRITTGRELDVAVDGTGWLVVQAPDGGEALTRNGNLRVDANGLLMNSADHPIMGEAGPVTLPPHDKLEIASDGTVSIVPQGQPASSLAVLDRLLLVDPDRSQLTKGDDGLVRDRNGAPFAPDAAVRLTSGQLETSNVNGVHAMVRMIELQRQFESQVRLMRIAEDNDAASSRLMRLR